MSADPAVPPEPPSVPPPRRPPTAREMLAAGFTHGDHEDGARGFAAGGPLDQLEPGPALAGFAGEAWDGGLAVLSDDELIGVLSAPATRRSRTTRQRPPSRQSPLARRAKDQLAGDRSLRPRPRNPRLPAITILAAPDQHASDNSTPASRKPGRKSGRRKVRLGGTIGAWH